MTDVSGKPIEDGTDRVSRNVGNYQSTLRNIQEEQRSHFHCGGSLKSCSRNCNNIYIYIYIYIYIRDVIKNYSECCCRVRSNGKAGIFNTGSGVSNLTDSV